MSKEIKIFSPQELKENNNEILESSDTFGLYLKRVIDEFNFKVAQKDFHPNSNQNRKYIFYPAEADYCKKIIFEKAVQLLQEVGWIVKYEIATCAEGWFNALIIENKL